MVPQSGVSNSSALQQQPQESTYTGYSVGAHQSSSRAQPEIHSDQLAVQSGPQSFDNGPSRRLYDPFAC